MRNKCAIRSPLCEHHQHHQHQNNTKTKHSNAAKKNVSKLKMLLHLRISYKIRNKNPLEMCLLRAATCSPADSLAPQRDSFRRAAAKKPTKRNSFHVRIRNILSCERGAHAETMATDAACCFVHATIRVTGSSGLVASCFCSGR